MLSGLCLVLFCCACLCAVVSRCVLFVNYRVIVGVSCVVCLCLCVTFC